MEWSAIQAAFPRDAVLQGIGSTEGELYLSLAAFQADAETLGDRYELIFKLLAAHYARSINDGTGSASGPVVSESVDGVSRSYAQAAATAGETDVDLSQTSYGAKAMALMRTCPAVRLPRMF